LAADFVENVDQVAPHVEQTKLENCEQADRPGTNNENVGFYRFGHVLSKFLSKSV
jgi:hypothetical protein